MFETFSVYQQRERERAGLRVFRETVRQSPSTEPALDAFCRNSRGAPYTLHRLTDSRTSRLDTRSDTPSISIYSDAHPSNKEFVPNLSFSKTSSMMRTFTREKCCSSLLPGSDLCHVCFESVTLIADGKYPPQVGREQGCPKVLALL